MAGLLTDEEEQMLNQQLHDCEDSTTNQIFVLPPFPRRPHN
ncbi:MAG: TPM domain-containing protein [Bacteroidia bacterium]